MKKRVLCWLLCLVLLIPGLALTVRADCAPKPSAFVKVHGGGGERVILTLLAQTEGWGPNGAVEPGAPASEHLDAQERNAWNAFVNYRDPDGYYFWGRMFDHYVNWTYYPPERFKIAVYNCQYDILWVSEESYDRYAFHADYVLTLPKATEASESGIIDMVVRRDTDWMEEGWEFLIRVVLTLLVELVLAHGWKYAKKEQLRVVLRVNLLTQVGLNAVLWAAYYYTGPAYALAAVFLLELAVLIVEFLLYLWKLPRKDSVWSLLGYTLMANLLSVILGFWLLDG